MINPEIPMFHVSLRHPDYGWQVVALSKSAEHCRGTYRIWHNRYPTLSIRAVCIDEHVPQAWRVIEQHVGTHVYKGHA